MAKMAKTRSLKSAVKNTIIPTATYKALLKALRAAYQLAVCDRNDGDDVAAMIRKALDGAKHKSS